MKKFVSLFTVLILAISMIVLTAPSAKAAGTLTSVTDTVTSAVAGATTVHTVQFTTATEGDITAVKITFPAGFDVSSAAFTSPGTNIGAGTTATSSQDITYNVTSPATIATSTAITLVLNDVVNTSTSNNNYTVAVTTYITGPTILDGPTNSTAFSINPVAISDLTCEPSGQAGAVWLRWTVPVGTSAGYETKYEAGNTITYGSATDFSQSWDSGTVGTAQQQLLTGLNPNTQYTFGAKAQGVGSTISAVSGTTPSCYSPGASASLQDATAPTSSITFPAYNSVLLAGQSVVIKGNANDAGGSSIQKVEVSLDGGKNWSSAKVMAQDIDANRMWEYTWINPAVGAYTIMSRAYDWVGNMETPGTGIQMTVATSVPETTVTTTTTTTIPPVLTTDEAIKAQIVTLQTQLIALLQQLLSMLMAQIAQLGL